MLYGIRKIEYCNAANLAFSDIFSQYVDTCTPTNQFTELSIVQQKATLKVESDIENKQVIYRAELQFDTIAESGLERGNLAFKVTTVNGEQFLIGSPSRPRVVVTTAHNVAESASGQSGFTTVCKFTAIYKPKTIPNTAEPVSDLRQFDICCGQIVGETPAPTRYTVIWQDEDGSEIERKYYYEGETEPSASATPANKVINELFGKQFSVWQLYEESGTTKTYRAAYNIGVFDWSEVLPTGNVNSDLETASQIYPIYFEALNTTAPIKAWIFYSYDGTTIRKSPYYSESVYGTLKAADYTTMLFAFVYNGNIDITESGLLPGTIESGVRGQWYALGTQGNYKVYGWRTADWQGPFPVNGVIIPMS